MLVRRPVSERAVGPDRVVLPSPPFCQYLRLFESVENLAVEQFIPQLPVEALVIAVLPRTP